MLRGVTREVLGGFTANVGGGLGGMLPQEIFMNN